MNRRYCRTAVALAVAALAMEVPEVQAQNVPSTAEGDEAGVSGSWEGAAWSPGGVLGLRLELTNADGAWTGTFAIPAEGVEVPLSGVHVTGDSLVIPLAPGRELRGTAAGDSVVGVLVVQGNEMRLMLGRAGSATAARLAEEVRAAVNRARPAPLERIAGGEDAGVDARVEPGVDALALDRLVEAAGTSHSHALVVLRNGELIGAWHAGGERRRIEAMSVTKSVLNLAIGRLVTLGAIGSLDEPVHAYYPEWANGQKSRITIRHLMNHTSGIASPMPTTPIYESEDFVRFALEAQQVAAPGTEFVYNNNATNLLADLAGRAAGERLDRFLARDLFARLGIDDFRWSLDPAGHPHGMAGLQVHAEDLARLGQLVLQRGQWEGERLIDDAWFDQSLKPGSELSDRSGLLWWLIHDDGELVGYRADGYLGQYLLIYPDEGLVAVRMVEQTPAYDPTTDGFDAFPALVKALVTVR